MIHVSEHRPVVLPLSLSGLVGEGPKESASADEGLEVAAQWTSHVTKKVRNNTSFPSDPFHKWAKGRVAFLRIDQGGYGNHKSNFNSEGSLTPQLLTCQVNCCFLLKFRRFLCPDGSKHCIVAA